MRGSPPKSRVRSPSGGDAGGDPGHVAGERVAHEGQQQQHRGADRDDLRHVDQRLLLDLGQGLEQRDHEADHQAAGLVDLHEALAGRVVFLALRRLFDRIVVRRNHAGEVGPRLGENTGIFDGGLVNQVAFAIEPQALDRLHLIGMEVTVFTEPGVVGEVGGFDDEGIALPSPT